MNFDLDQYYTPPDIAENILLECKFDNPEICVDSTCGSGNLLTAANKVFGDIKCVGLDRDKKAIANLKRLKPNWTLSVADLMKPNSFRRTIAIAEYSRCDLLLLNPPFSQNNKKSIEVEYYGQNLKCSIAMAHILRSFELFKPNQGAVIIVPESILFSELDLIARKTISLNYNIEVLSELGRATFKGARVRATIIKISHDKKRKNNVINYSPKNTLKVKLMRGSLPVHKAKLSNAGHLFIHSTDLNYVNPKQFQSLNRLTKIKRTGYISGHVLLFPRVGLPKKDNFIAISLTKKVQLSDCVLALECKTQLEAQKLCCRIELYWSEFISLYRGTGARYITLNRLKTWLSSINIITQSHLL